MVRLGGANYVCVSWWGELCLCFLVGVMFLVMLGEFIFFGRGNVSLCFLVGLGEFIFFGRAWSGECKFVIL